MPVRVARSARGLRINLVEVVEEKGKRRIVHVSTFSSKPEQPGGGGGRLTRQRTGTRFQNVTPGGRDGPNYQDGAGAAGQVRDRKKDLDAENGREECLSACGSGSSRAANFGYVLGGYLFIDSRLQFGCKGSLGWWGVIANAIQQARR